MKSKNLFIISIILLSLILIFTFTITSAQSEMPDGYTAFYPSDNLVCLDKDGVFSGCWCCPDDGDCKSVDRTPIPTKKPNNPTATPKEPTSTPEPIPTEKPKCNSGRGNNSEGEPDCDPGNSGGHNQGGD